MTRAVLLDALGTVLTLEPPGPGLRRALRARGVEVTADAADRAMAAEISYYRAHLMSGRDAGGVRVLRRRCAEVLAAALPVEPRERLSAGEVEAAMLEALQFTPFPEVPETLRGLRAAGRRLVVVSNWDRSLHDVLETAGLGAQLDGVVTAAEVGAAKPAPEIFTAALAIAGVPANQALHVGDQLDEDVAGARAAGIEPLLVARDGPPLQPPPSGVRVIASLAELAVTGP